MRRADSPCGCPARRGAKYLFISGGCYERITAGLLLHKGVIVGAIAAFSKKFKYHHGDLRTALIDAALHLLATEGAEGLSLRGVARATGVTQAAPYSHFTNKEELLAAVAEAGHRKLALRMVEAATGQPDTQARLEKLMGAYIGFAAENKPLFSLMFSGEIAAMKNYPTLAMTAGKSYALFSSALAKHGGAETAVLAVAAWSLCHGLTTLIIDGKIDPAKLGVADTAALVSRCAGLFI